MGQLVLGNISPAYRPYTTGYVLGSNGEAPFANLYLTADATFSGFVTAYPAFTPGTLVITQDPVGGHTVNFGSFINFVGSSDINTAANSVTIIDLLKVTSVAWVGSIRGKGTSSSAGNLPAGGAQGSVLKKNSSADYDASWNTLSKSDVGLDAVDNTSDTDKPISTLQLQALNLKAPLQNPTFTGKTTVAPSGGTGAGFNIGVGTAPAAPVSGDFWAASDGFYGRIGSTTVQIGAKTTIASQDIQIAASDLTTNLIAATSVGYTRVLRAGTIKEIRASLSVASSSGSVTIDVKKNGTSMFSTQLTIDPSELTSVTAAVPAVLNTAQTSLVSDDVITVDIIGGGTGARGLIVGLIYENLVTLAGGLNTQIQFSDGGSLAGNSSFTFDKNTNTVSATNLTVTGTLTYSGMLANPMTTAGDLIVGGTSGSPTRLAKGSDGQYLKMVGGAVTWATPSAPVPTFTWNAQSGASYTLVLADANNGVALTSGSANTVTVPTNATVAFPIGTTITLTQDGAGTTTVAAASGVVINKRGGGSLVSSGQYAILALVKRDTDTWILTGDLTS